MTSVDLPAPATPPTITCWIGCDSGVTVKASLVTVRVRVRVRVRVGVRVRVRVGVRVRVRVRVRVTGA